MHGQAKKKKNYSKAHKERDPKEREKKAWESPTTKPFLRMPRPSLTKQPKKTTPPNRFCSLVCVHICKRRKEKANTLEKFELQTWKNLCMVLIKREELSFLSMVGLVGLLIGLHLTLNVLSIRYILG